MLPSHIAHPVEDVKASARDKGKVASKQTAKAGRKLSDTAPGPSDVKKQTRQLTKQARKKAKEKSKKRKKRLNSWLP